MLIFVLVTLLNVGFVNAQPGLFVGTAAQSSVLSTGNSLDQSAFQYPPGTKKQFPAFQVSSSGTLLPNGHLIPGYIRENPLQYSYLCRLELNIEEKLPVGLWLRIDQPGFGQPFRTNPGNVYFNMKMLRF